MKSSADNKISCVLYIIGILYKIYSTYVSICFTINLNNLSYILSVISYTKEPLPFTMYNPRAYIRFPMNS